MPDNETTEDRPLVEEMETGRFRVLLPSGKRPVVKPVHPKKLYRIYRQFRMPDPPDGVIPIPGRGLGQLYKDRKNPQFVQDSIQWWIDHRNALLERFVVSALVVPEDADFTLDNEPLIAMPTCPEHHKLGSVHRWRRLGFSGKDLETLEMAEECTCITPEHDWSVTLRRMGVFVPKEDGSDRQHAYVEEALDELLEDAEEQEVFIEAVKSISIPTEARIRDLRRSFRDEVERAITDEPEAADGGDPGAPGT